jgi:hypothetical protein
MHRLVLGLVVIVLSSGCSESMFEEGRYAFDGSPPVHRRSITSITLEPIPEGSSQPLFVMDPESEEFVRQEMDLAAILPSVPDPLPATLDQGDCEFGGDLVITTDGGTTIAYGPCRRPRSINELRARILEFISDS